MWLLFSLFVVICFRTLGQAGQPSDKNRMEVTNMAYKITDSCVACGSCAAQCPTEAISEGDGIYVIDADVCVSCGACAEQCPTEAIVEE